MKSFASPSFFRVFDLWVSISNPGLKQSRWMVDGVECERERHSFSGAKHGLTIEIFTLARPGKRSWSLMIVKEFWWAGKETAPIKMTHWAKLIGGQRADAFAWLRAQEIVLERRPVPEQKTAFGSAKGER